MKNKETGYYLYFDTSQPEAVVSIFLKKGEKEANLVTEIRWHAHRELSLTLSSKIQDVIKKAKIFKSNLVGVVVFAGPGSFTGLRIGISFANAFAYGLGIPIYATKEKDKIDLSNPSEIVVPEYGAEPKITKPKTK